MSKKLEKGKSYGGWMEQGFSIDKDGYLVRHKRDLIELGKNYKFPFDSEFSGSTTNEEVSLDSSDGWKYVGQWKDKKPNGDGTVFRPDGIFYRGEMKDGMPNGKGKSSYKSDTNPLMEGESEERGWIFEGDWVNGIPEGLGTLDLNHPVWGYGNMKYEGEISQGVPHGFGNCIYPAGIKYEGMWWDGYEHGDGTRLYPNGERIEGTWSVGEPFTVKRFDKKGNLVFMMIEDVPYEGEFKNDKPWNVNVYDGRPLNLIGQFTNGNWNEGIPDGNGIQHFINSDNEEKGTIIGEFKGGQTYNGFKFLRVKDPKSYTVDIIKGKFVKGSYIDGIQEETFRTVSFSDGFKYLGFYYKNKGLVYDEIDSQGNKTDKTISKKILEDKIDNPIFEKLLKD